MNQPLGSPGSAFGRSGNYEFHAMFTTENWPYRIRSGVLICYAACSLFVWFCLI